MTSDEFFKNNKDQFDLIFIDGLHHYNQVKKDIINSVEVLKDGGIILMLIAYLEIITIKLFQGVSMIGMVILGKLF